ncbi:hypothetical protein HDE_12521 [Halotydeus destructor]|nr:hypothetical protein HDE_12521 [Halotydeus destructor]
MFCRAKYAAIVTLGSAAKQLDDGLYSAHAMKVRHVLRSSGDEAERAMAAEVLFTRKRRNSCALDIVVKGTYVIFGEPTTDGRAVANTCNAINVDLLTDAEKGQLEQFTKHGVPCR